jgi:hypothetical protein
LVLETSVFVRPLIVEDEPAWSTLRKTSHRFSADGERRIWNLLSPETVVPPQPFAIVFSFTMVRVKLVGRRC